jgi:hypothetical protein
MSQPQILGFRPNPEKTANGEIYKGRLVCSDVQITGSGLDAIATFTVTARQLLDAASSEMLWTDQDVQRGVRPEVSNKVPRELSLSKGYPDNSIYIFNVESADEMTDKLLYGERFFINPLVWNLRPGNFEAYLNSDKREIYIYDGKIYLPDSHHRHQAILKAAKIYKQAPNDYPKFDLDKQFKVELYFLKREDEGNYFFDKNQRPTPTAKSKAYDLTTQDDLSVLAKRVVELTESLQGNVNRVTDRLTSRNPDVVTLSTLRESLKTAADFDSIDETEMEGVAQVTSIFFKLLTEVRPEIGLLPIAERKLVREISLVDAPIMFQGYGALIADFNLDVSKMGVSEATNIWKIKLRRLSSDIVYREGAWQGELFNKNNPFWTRLGIVKPGLTKLPTVNNNRGSRLQAAKALRAVINSSINNLDLQSILP